MARVAADGSRCPGTRAHRALVGVPRAPGPGADLLEGPALGQPHVDPVEDRGGEERRQPAGRALVGRRTSGGVTHTPPLDPGPASPRAALTVRISVSSTRADGPGLGHPVALGGQRHRQVEHRAGRGVGQVLGGGPHRGPARRRLQRHQGGTQPAPAEEEVARGGQLGHDRQPPVERRRPRGSMPRNSRASVTGSPRGGRRQLRGTFDPRQLLVHPHVPGQSEDALAEDVALDLRGAALDGVGPRPEEHTCGTSPAARPARALGPPHGVVVADQGRRRPAGRRTARRCAG